MMKGRLNKGYKVYEEPGKVYQKQLHVLHVYN